MPPFDVSDAGPNVLHIELGGAAISLAQVTVKGDDVCRIRADSGKLVAQLWEQARQALVSTQLTSAGGSVQAGWLTYSRVLDGTGWSVYEQKTATEAGYTTHAFGSIPADSLARAGYALSLPDGKIEYHGPDADALISDHFAANHCFRVLPPSSERPQSVGVAFRPARNREGLVDIAGTFWLDRETAELYLLEYQYTNLPRGGPEAGARGRIEFVRLATGNWLVNRWNIHVELLVVASADTSRFPTGIRSVPREDIRVARQRQIHIFGGEVTSAVRDYRELYDTIGTVFDAIVVPSIGAPLSIDGVTVELAGPHYFAAAEDSGRVHFARLAPTSYMALATTADMRASALPAIPRPVTVSRTLPRAATTIALPTGDELLRAVCGDGAVKRGEGFVAGSYRSADGVPLARDSLFLRYTKLDTVGARASQQSIRRYTAITDAFGRWQACSVPRGATITVSTGKIATGTILTPSDSTSITLRQGDRFVLLHVKAPPVP